MASYKGSCLCGAVTYEYDDPVSDFRYCFCPRCRKATGSAHVANIFVKPEQFHWKSGQEHVKRYDLPEARSFATCFCTICGSPLPHATRSAKRVVIPAGSLDDDPGVKPNCSIWWSERAPWYLTADELRRYDEEPC